MVRIDRVLEEIMSKQFPKMSDDEIRESIAKIEFDFNDTALQQINDLRLKIGARMMTKTELDQFMLTSLAKS